MAMLRFGQNGYDVSDMMPASCVMWCLGSMICNMLCDLVLKLGVNPKINERVWL